MFSIMDDDGNVLMVEEPSQEYVYTYADYLKWKFEERLELFKGKIFKMAAPNTKHQEVSGNLFFMIRSHLADNPCKVFSAPFDVRLPVQNRKKDTEITTVVQPDLCVVCDMSKLDEKGCCGAPDTIAEILSPGNSRKEVQQKFSLYEETGVPEYWIINPVEENLIIYTLRNGKYIGSKPYAPDEIITSSVLQGIRIEVSAIFKK